MALSPNSGVGHHGRDGKARRAHLSQQGQRQPPFLLKSRGRRNAGLRTLTRGQPRLGQIQGGAQEPGPRARPQRDRDRRLAIRDLAARAGILAGDADRRRALFRQACAVENQHAAPLRHRHAQPCPHRLGVPRGMRDEMLKRLIGARIAQARPHRFHRLAATVTQYANHITSQGPTLTPTTEVVFEYLQPPQQSRQPRGCGAIEHCEAV